MPPVVAALFAFLSSLFRSHCSLALQVFALQHQVAVYKQTVRRPRPQPTDRLLWAWLSRLWPGWQATLAFVQPRTAIVWQKKRFRDHWRRLRQRGTPGRLAVPREVGVLIALMRSVSASASAYFQSMRARTASAAWASDSPSAHGITVMRASCAGASAGRPVCEKKVAKVAFV
jgi:hypothetical protein